MVYPPESVRSLKSTAPTDPFQAPGWCPAPSRPNQPSSPTASAPAKSPADRRDSQQPPLQARPLPQGQARCCATSKTEEAPMRRDHLVASKLALRVALPPYSLARGADELPTPTSRPSQSPGRRGTCRCVSSMTRAGIRNEDGNHRRVDRVSPSCSGPGPRAQRRRKLVED